VDGIALDHAIETLDITVDLRMWRRVLGLLMFTGPEGLKCESLCKIDGTFGLPEVTNIVEADRVGSRHGDLGEFSTLVNLKMSAC